MSKRTVFTTITPLPADVSRAVAVQFLHNHLEMIDLNPLVVERHPIPVPAHAAPEEARCEWYSLTDRISYLPGDRMVGSISYTCAFHNLPDGLQTHCFAPMGLDIRDKWSVAGRLPGEPPEPVELGIGAPSAGLYIREDIDMRCNILMAGFVKKTLKRAHAGLVETLKLKAQMASSSAAVARTEERVDDERAAPRFELAPSQQTRELERGSTSLSLEPSASRPPSQPHSHSQSFSAYSPYCDRRGSPAASLHATAPPYMQYGTVAGASQQENIRYEAEPGQTGTPSVPSTMVPAPLRLRPGDATDVTGRAAEPGRSGFIAELG